MGVQLLDTTRKINKLLHNNNSSKVVFNDICQVLNGAVSYTHLDVYKRQVMLSVKGEEYTYSYIKKEVLKGHIPYEKDKINQLEQGLHV